MDSAPLKTYAGPIKNVAAMMVRKKKAAAFKKSYQAPAVSGTSFTGAGSAGTGVGG